MKEGKEKLTNLSGQLASTLTQPVTLRYVANVIHFFAISDPFGERVKRLS